MKPDTNKLDRLYFQEKLILEITEAICDLMGEGSNRPRELKVSRAELAELTGKSRSHITQLLDGQNLELRTVADLCTALGFHLKVVPVPIETCRFCGRSGGEWE